MSGWNRKLWGVECVTATGSTMLIGCAWLRADTSHYDGEPTRALLFMSRQQAREWCRKKSKEYDDPHLGFCFRPVRVIETVKKA